MLKMAVLSLDSGLRNKLPYWYQVWRHKWFKTVKISLTTCLSEETDILQELKPLSLNLYNKIEAMKNWV